MLVGMNHYAGMLIALVPWSLIPRGNIPWSKPHHRRCPVSGHPNAVRIITVNPGISRARANRTDHRYGCGDAESDAKAHSGSRERAARQ
jgi:hypothetical protein